MFFRFKKPKLKTSFFGQKGCCSKSYSLLTCVLRNVKSYRFLGGPFLGQILVDVQKHYKIGIFSTFLKAKKYHLSKLLTGPS